MIHNYFWRRRGIAVLVWTHFVGVFGYVGAHRFLLFFIFNWHHPKEGTAWALLPLPRASFIYIEYTHLYWKDGRPIFPSSPFTTAITFLLYPNLIYDLHFCLLVLPGQRRNKALAPSPGRRAVKLKTSRVTKKSVLQSRRSYFKRPVATFRFLVFVFSWYLEGNQYWLRDNSALRRCRFPCTFVLLSPGCLEEFDARVWYIG